MNKLAPLASALTLLTASALAYAAQSPPSVDDLINRIESRSVRANPGVGSGALAPQNLAKKRPAAPFNMTGTWFPDLSGAFGGFRFGPPYPEFIGETKADFEKGQEMVRTRTPWRDTIGQCYPAGIPISEEFKVVERIRLTEKGKALEIEYIMTDPNGWVGEWRTKKRWLRLDRTDIAQVDCLPDLNDNIPSTQAGRSGLTD